MPGIATEPPRLSTILTAGRSCCVRDAAHRKFHFPEARAHITELGRGGRGGLEGWGHIARLHVLQLLHRTMLAHNYSALLHRQRDRRDSYRQMHSFHGRAEAAASEAQARWKLDSHPAPQADEANGSWIMLDLAAADVRANRMQEESLQSTAICCRLLARKFAAH